MDRAEIRSEWEARPSTVKLFVVGSLAGFVFSVVRDPGSFGFPSILFSAVFLGLLWKLWEGERAMWWLFVVVSAAGIVAGATAGLAGEPAAWAGAAAGAFALMLLLAEPTRTWVDRRSDSNG